MITKEGTPGEAASSRGMGMHVMRPQDLQVIHKKKNKWMNTLALDID